MNRYEYEITTHSSESFKKVVYFCTDRGDCSVDEVPVEEPGALVSILNERGASGWELIQIMFGKKGVMAFWKRRITD
ncbi:MAG: hypothetical protein PHS86_14365 [Syntrophaceae bacterium]|nr:hypothetical protein [Syntrophaceae bacterium]